MSFELEWKEAASADMLLPVYLDTTSELNKSFDSAPGTYPEIDVEFATANETCTLQLLKQCKKNGDWRPCGTMEFIDMHHLLMV